MTKLAIILQVRVGYRSVEVAEKIFYFVITSGGNLRIHTTITIEQIVYPINSTLINILP